MSYVTITGDPAADLDGFADDLPDRLDEAMRINAYFLAENMKELTPVRTGETAASIGVDEAWLEYDVGSDSPIFNFLDQGTSGHGPIVPVNAKALHWLQDGEDVFAKYVLYVSGIGALNIIDTAVEISEPIMDANIELAIDAAFDESMVGGDTSE